MTLKEDTARYKERVQTVLDAAVTLALGGLSVFPCHDKKAPSCPGGFHAATADPIALKSLWNRYPGTLIGVPTGEKTGLDVLDIDPRHGGMEWLNAHRESLPPTRMHHTRSGGIHFLFQHHQGLRNSAGRLAPGVDVRAEGGYILWWPATGLKTVYDTLLAAWPDWIIQNLCPPQQTFAMSPMEFGTGYAFAALKSAATSVIAAPEGSRNETLNREVWSLSRFFTTGELHPSDVAAALSEAALAAGLSRDEIIATVASALRARGV